MVAVTWSKDGRFGVMVRAKSIKLDSAPTALKSTAA
jgi:hypothetical protein